MTSPEKCPWCHGPHDIRACVALQHFGEAVDAMPQPCPRCGFPRTDDTVICRACGEGRAA